MSNIWMTERKEVSCKEGKKIRSYRKEKEWESGETELGEGRNEGS